MIQRIVHNGFSWDLAGCRLVMKAHGWIVDIPRDGGALYADAPAPFNDLVGKRIEVSPCPHFSPRYLRM